MRKCARCKRVLRRQAPSVERKFCGRGCANAAAWRTPWRRCENCRKSFRKRCAKRYCSKSCAAFGMRKGQLRGRTFGFLRVLRPEGRGHGSWLCECACGARVLRTSHQLTTDGRSRSVSCGCQRNHTKLQDLTGQTIHGVEVLRRVADRPAAPGRPRYECLCRCGVNTMVVEAGHLKKTGSTCKDCQRKRLSEQRAKRYELFGASLTLKELATLAGVPPETLRQRLLRHPVAVALQKPLGRGIRAHEVRA